MSGASVSSVPKQLTPWVPGQSGNPAGRPKGSRNKLSEDFLGALAQDFSEHGIEAVIATREESPDVYIRVIASLMPKQLELKEGNFGDVSDGDLIAFLDTVRQALSLRAAVGAGSLIEGEAKPAEVLQPVSEAETIP